MTARPATAPGVAVPARTDLTANPHDRDVPPSPLPRAVQWLLVAGVVVVFLAALVFILLDRWRRGTVAVGTGMVGLAVLRWLVDPQVLGVWAVRSRRFDSAFCLVAGGIILWLALSVDALGS
ncbi:DUF3017 domain-containing protein [Corynebacterium bovis]|uniref:DUF3017 domain-containing protein n=1 Tax=Corynebacterium bovis TaxID=36808 RepID=UPI003139951C